MDNGGDSGGSLCGPALWHRQNWLRICAGGFCVAAPYGSYWDL